MGINLDQLKSDNPLRGKIRDALTKEYATVKNNVIVKTDFKQPATEQLIPYSMPFTKKKVFWLTVRPMGKPRMTQSDKWKQNPNHPDPKKRMRKAIYKWKEYKAEIQRQIGDFEMPKVNYWMIFYMPTYQKTWSDKKKREHHGRIHQLKPDKDNLEKGVLDALLTEDKEIADGRVSKIWCKNGQQRIEIFFI